MYNNFNINKYTKHMWRAALADFSKWNHKLDYNQNSIHGSILHNYESLPTKHWPYDPHRSMPSENCQAIDQWIKSTLHAFLHNAPNQMISLRPTQRFCYHVHRKLNSAPGWLRLRISRRKQYPCALSMWRRNGHFQCPKFWSFCRGRLTQKTHSQNGSTPP